MTDNCLQTFSEYALECFLSTWNSALRTGKQFSCFHVGRGIGELVANGAADLSKRVFRIT